MEANMEPPFPARWIEHALGVLYALVGLATALSGGTIVLVYADPQLARAALIAICALLSLALVVILICWTKWPA